jgi:hypothetical protein
MPFAIDEAFLTATPTAPPITGSIAGNREVAARDSSA